MRTLVFAKLVLRVQLYWRVLFGVSCAHTALRGVCVCVHPPRLSTTSYFSFSLSLPSPSPLSLLPTLSQNWPIRSSIASSRTYSKERPGRMVSRHTLQTAAKLAPDQPKTPNSPLGSSDDAVAALSFKSTPFSPLCWEVKG